MKPLEVYRKMYVVDIKDRKLKAFRSLEDANDYIINSFINYIEDMYVDDPEWECNSIDDFYVRQVKGYDITLYKVKDEVELDVTRLFEEAMVYIREHAAVERERADRIHFVTFPIDPTTGGET